MRRILDTTSTPPGGWLYRDPLTGVEFKNLSYNAVAMEATRHRAAMGHPTGSDWTEEFQGVIIDLCPGVRWEDSERPKKHYNSDDLVRFITTMQELSGNNLVSEEEQSRRAAICVACPKNGIIPCKFCGWVSRQITGFTAGRKVAHRKEIFRRACLACGCDLSAKTAVPMDVLTSVDEQLTIKPDYAPGCWMLEELH